MKGLRFLEVAWRLVRMLAAPLGALVLVAATYAMYRPVWWFYALMLALSLVPVVLGWESNVYCGYLAFSVVWSFVLVLFDAKPLTKLILMCLTLAPSMIELMNYEAVMWSFRDQRSHFDEFPYRFLSAKRRLELGFEMDGGSSIERRDIERVSYDDARDLLRRIALEAPYGSDRLAALARMRYPEDADVIRELALSAPTEDLSFAALLRLPYPQEAALLEERLPAWPDYAKYSLGLGWPHEHDFRFVSSTREGTDDSYTEHVRYACACGMTKTVVSHTITFESSGCPQCGGHLHRAYYGDYSWRWECSQCGWIDDEDGYTVPDPSFTNEQTSVLSTTYEMEGTAS